MIQRIVVPLALLLLGVAAGQTVSDDQQPVNTAAGIEFFEKKVRPVLAENCYPCHGAKRQRAGLRLDSLSAILAGGDRGQAIVPGKPDESRLIQALRYTDEELRMPPKGKLPDNLIADL